MFNVAETKNRKIESNDNDTRSANYRESPAMWRTTLCPRDAEDVEIFQAARAANVVVMSKDSDFPELVERLGSPPQVLWVTCGNTSNRSLKELFQKCLQTALDLLDGGEPIVEINDRLQRQ